MSTIGWTKAGCRSLGPDEQIQAGDWVAECEGGERSIGVPGDWFRADGMIGKTPRRAHVFACRPLPKGGEA